MVACPEERGKAGRAISGLLAMIGVSAEPKRSSSATATAMIRYVVSAVRKLKARVGVTFGIGHQRGIEVHARPKIATHGFATTAAALETLVVPRQRERRCPSLISARASRDSMVETRSGTRCSETGMGSASCKQ